MGAELATMGIDAAGKPILALLAKRSYAVVEGRCVPLDPQPPLREELELDGDDPRVLLGDIETYPLKPATDVVVRGQAWNPGAGTSFDAAVQVGAAGKVLRVRGPRRATRVAGGGIAFSESESVESVPLHAGAAYGGGDLVADARHGNDLALIRKFLAPSLQAACEGHIHHSYPRNPAGRGFVLADDAESIDAVELPLLEDPEDPLTPERLVVGAMERWPAQPLPAYLGWMDPAWFPRGIWFQIRPAFDPELAAPWTEQARGLLTADDLTPAPGGRADIRCASGAPLGLRLPYLAGDERIVLHHCRPGLPRWQLQLPGQRPTMRLELAGGKTVKPKPRLYTIEIDAEAEQVHLVWGGTVPPNRPYLPAELADLPRELRW